MPYDGYQLSEPVSATTHVHAPKGVMVVGAGTAVLHPYKAPNYTSGLTGYAVAGASGDGITITGTVQGTIFPVAVSYVGAIAGCTVHTLS